MHAVNVETRTALVRMRRIFRWSKDAILHRVEAGIEIRARVGARSQIAAEAESALRVDVAAKSEIGGATESLVVSSRESHTLRAGAAEGRRQKTGSAITRLDRDGRVRQVKNRNVFQFQLRRIHAHAIAGLNGCFACVEAPLRHVFVTGRHLHVQRHDRVEADALHAIGGEVDARSVLRLIGVAGGVDEVTGLGAIVPIRARTGDALQIRLIENDVAFRDDSVFRLVDSDFVCLQAIRADAHVNVAFVNKNARVFRPGRGLLRSVDRDLINAHALHRGLFRGPARSRLFAGERIDVRRVGQWICYFAIDRISLLRKYKLAGQNKQQVCQHNTQKRVEPSAEPRVS